MEYFDRIISLGQDCGVAGSLRTIKYKEFSYPFDWNITSLNFIIECFKNKFQNFENIINDCIPSKNGKLKYKNDIYFYHDITKEIKEKYIKRGLRLHNLLNEDKKILFVRKAPNDLIQDIKFLKKTIQENYPNLNFKILLLNNIENENINDEHIIHKYYNLDCFVSYNNDVYKHRNMKRGYKCVYQELKNFDSIKFEQPEKRDIN